MSWLEYGAAINLPGPPEWGIQASGHKNRDLLANAHQVTRKRGSETPVGAE
jgi:hypothetical protein